jgi:CubicO group peptidase (beta-lactamase class C family)
LLIRRFIKDEGDMLQHHCARLCSLLALLAIALSLSSLQVNAGIALDTGTLSAVDHYIRAEMDELKIPGLELAIVNADQVVYIQGYGTADSSRQLVTAQTPMILGSLSKGFTALAVLQLVETGKIDLDAPATTYLPWFRMASDANGVPADAWQHYHRSPIAQPYQRNNGVYRGCFVE